MFKRQIEPWVVFMLLSVMAHAAMLVTWGGRLGVSEASLDESVISHSLNVQLVKQPLMEKPENEIPPEHLNYD